MPIAIPSTAPNKPFFVAVKTIAAPRISYRLLLVSLLSFFTFSYIGFVGFRTADFVESVTPSLVE